MKTLSLGLFLFVCLSVGGEWGARRTNKGSETCVTVFLTWHFQVVDIYNLTFRERLVCSVKYELCCGVLVSL